MATLLKVVASTKQIQHGVSPVEGSVNGYKLILNNRWSLQRLLLKDMEVVDQKIERTNIICNTEEWDHKYSNMRRIHQIAIWYADPFYNVMIIFMLMTVCDLF